MIDIVNDSSLKYNLICYNCCFTPVTLVHLVIIKKTVFQIILVLVGHNFGCCFLWVQLLDHHSQLSKLYLLLNM